MLVPCGRPGGVLARHASDLRAARGSRLPDPVLPPDHQGLSVGRRRLHRHPRQLRPAPRAGRRRGPAHRLRADGRGVGGRRQRRARVRRSTSLAPYKHWIAIAFVLFIAYGNLRGTKESGKLFAVPTYFFIVNMFILHRRRRRSGRSPRRSPRRTAGRRRHGSDSARTHGNGLLMGATVFIVLKAFGSGGAAVTGVEAISNGVPAFRQPAWKNARTTLVIMGSLLGDHVPRPVDAGRARRTRCRTTPGYPRP